MKTTFIITWMAAIALLGCSDNRPEVDGRSDDDVVEGMRIFYPGGQGFSEYSYRVIIRGAGIVPELIAASRDTDSKMRESAARCLGQIATDEAVTRLIEMTSDEENEEGIWIALSYAASSRAIPVLQAELSSRSDPRSRGQLLMTLVEYGDTSQLPDLLEYMKTSCLPGHIYHANLVFEKLAGRRFNKDTKKIEEWLRERNADVEAFQEAAAANHSESLSPSLPRDLMICVAMICLDGLPRSPIRSVSPDVQERQPRRLLSRQSPITVIRDGGIRNCSAEEMKIHSARLICHPSPPNPLCGQLHQGEICYYANCETTEAFAIKIEEFLKSENWELARVEVSGVTTADALQGKPEVLSSLERHGDFAMILGKHGSDN